jgi:hypothetical protein
MRLIGLPVFLAVSLPLAPVAVEAQQAERVYRIGLLSASSESAAAGVEAYRGGLRTLGYVEGRNVVIEHRFSTAKITRVRLPKITRAGL